MPKVYIINKSCHDYSMAEKYGEITYLTESSYNRFSTGKMFRSFKNGLKDSNPEDFLLISGLTIMSSIACSMFAAKHKRLNLLLYNSGPNVEEGYVKRTIILEEL